MAIEDEIINIAELDVGTELLNTDKLLVETNNGTRLLDFKDFVIGPDNISSVREDQIEYPQAGEGAAKLGTTAFESITSFNVLTTSTSPGVRTAYKDLSGGIELSKFNYSAIATVAAASASWTESATRLAGMQSQIDEVAADTGSTALSAVNFRAFNNKVTYVSRTGNFRRWITFNDTDRDPTKTHKSAASTIEFKYKDVPFYIKYPSSETWDQSWILFTGRFKTTRTNGFNRSFNISLKRGDGTEITTGFPGDVITATGKPKTMIINHVELIHPDDKLYLVASDVETFAADTFFAGFRIAAG